MIKAAGLGDARNSLDRDASLNPAITDAIKYRGFAALLR
jgi:hypothetical protein